MKMFSFARRSSAAAAAKKPAKFGSSGSSGQLSSNQSRGYRSNSEEMRRVFERFDTNRDGKISKEEYKLAVKSLGGAPSSDSLSSAFDSIDTNRDGTIDFDEFVRFQSVDGKVKAADIKSAFLAFDLDGNGKISAEELFEVMKVLGESCSLEGCRKMVRCVDADGDGLVNLDEFMTMMTNSMKLPR